MAQSEVVVVFNEAGLHDLASSPQVRAYMDRVAAESVMVMKRFANVSPVGPFHRSGTMRSSIHAFPGRDAAGAPEYVIGPTADYAKYVNDGTPPHLIMSRGPWPLRNRETGQVFGRVVHHPGYLGSHFVERTAAVIGATRGAVTL